MFGATSYASQRRKSVKIRTPMPELLGATTWVNSKEKKREDFLENVTIISFWSISCPSCKKNVQQLRRLAETYKGKVNVLFVHMPRDVEDQALVNVKKVVKDYEINEPVAVDSNLALSNRFGNRFVPSYYVFDQAGLLRHYQGGDRGFRLLEQRVKRLLTEAGK